MGQDLEALLEAHLDDVTATIRTAADRLVRRIEEEEAGLAGEIVDRVVARIGDSVRMRVDALAGHLRDSPDAERAVQGAMEILRTTVEAALAAQARRVEGIIVQARADLSAVVESQAAGLAQGAGPVVEVVRREVDRLDRTVAQVREVVESEATRFDQAAAALARTVDTQGERSEAATTAVGMAVEAQGQRIDALTSSLADGHTSQREEVGRQLGALREEMTSHLDGVADSLRGDLRGIQKEVTSAIEQAHIRFRDAAKTGLAEATAGFQSAVTAAVAEMRAMVEVLDTRVSGVEAQLGAAATAIGSAERTLSDHLDERRREAAIERAALTHDFVEQLAVGLTRRERRRLAQRLRMPEEPATPPPAGDAPAVPPEPADEEPAAGVAVPAPGPPRPAATDASEPGSDAEPDTIEPARRNDSDEPPSWERPTPRRVRPRPPGRARTDPPEGSSTPGDPAALRRTLAAVRGLGPAKQSALIDAFGSLEAIRHASDEELLAIRGIGPSLIRPIRNAVR